MNVAIVDIGTNSTRLLLAEVEDGRVRREIERQSIVTRLGEGVDNDRRLHDEPMERVFQALEKYVEMIERHGGAEKREAVLTSAVRDAENGQEFAETVKERFGLTPHVLAGEQEAQLTFLGATSERDPDEDTPTLVIDIGGGSTELVVGHRQQAGFHVSTQAGVVRQSERHIHTDPPEAEELDALRRDVDRILREAVPNEERRAVRNGIAVAGTATSLGAIAQRLDPYDPEKVHGYVLREDERAQICEMLTGMTLEQRRGVAGLHPDRAPTIVPGVMILGAVMELFGLRQVEISEHDILRGAAIGL